MRALKRILEHLLGSDYKGPLILAPGAPPVCRDQSGVQVVLELILTAEDVTDILVHLKALQPITGLATVKASMETAAPPGASDRTWAAKSRILAEAETFSFGILEVGRFRVDYLTQRGTRIVSVARIPFEIPETSTICEDAETVERIMQLLTSSQGGLLGVTGPSIVSSSVFLYSLLREVNEAARKVIYILERSLTFLMNHNSSIVIQSELFTDAQSFEEGVVGAYPFRPDIVFVGDVWPADRIPSLRSAERQGKVAIVASSSLSGEQILDEFWPRTSGTGAAVQGTRASVEVLPSGPEAVTATLKQYSPRA
jgi:twitching motility protein PilT